MQQPRKKCRVFVVHNEPVIASSLELILSHEGFEAKSFTKPLEALQVASSQAPDILISDAAMPVVSGIELAISIQQHRPGCKVLLFSAQANPDAFGHHSADHNSFEFIQKPVHPGDLLKRIQILLEKNPGMCGDEKVVEG
ncbi:MAG: response regulator [Terracidiphilus sp.]